MSTVLNEGMESIISEIEGYVIVLDPTLKAGSTISALGDSITREFIDRVLSYTNRTQLIYCYERAVDLYGFAPANDSNVIYNSQTFDYDGGYKGGEIACPLPKQMRRPIARAIVSFYKTISAGDVRAISSITDNGQSVTYKEDLLSYMATAEDSKLFVGIKDLLDKFILFSV